MTDQENGLPAGWELLPVKNLGKVITGNTPPTKELDNYGGDIPFIKPSELLDRPVSIGRETISGKGAEKARIAPKGGVLVSCIGNLGKTAIAKQDVAFNQQINTIVFNESVIPEYGFYYFQTVKFHKDLESLASATTISIVNKSKFESISVPVAPPEQQHRIVAEIEKQFSRLDEAVAGLKRIQVNLKRYRASVLKAAVEGKLTAEWRKQHPDTEPAEQLLQRILKERRIHWEQAELQKMQAAGKPPKDDKWKQKYKEPVAADISDLPALPKGWVWARLDIIASLKGGITVDKNKTSSDFIKVPYLRVANVQRGHLDLTEIKEILATKQKIDQLLLKRNDILFNEGGDIDKLGRGWIWEEQLAECIHQNHVFRARLFLLNVEAKFVSWWGNTFGRDYFLREGKQTTNLASINLTKLSCFPVPLPSHQEQTQIVSEIERRLSIADEVEQQININLKRAERLRQAILKKAFSGRLVPQDPNDEPADVLLEKIKQAQRA